MYSKRNNKYNYLLAGKLYCDDCGTGMTMSTKRSTRKLQGREYGPYLQEHYYCMGRSLGKKCQMRWIRKDRIESIVWAEIRKIVKNPSLIEKVIRSQKTDKGRKTALADEIKGIEKDIHSRRIERDKVLRMYRKGTITEQEAIIECDRLFAIYLEYVARGNTGDKNVYELDSKNPDDKFLSKL